LRKLRGGIKNGRRFVAKSFAGSGFLQFGDSSDVSCVEVAYFGELLALNYLGMLEAFRKTAIVIDQRGVIFQDTAFYLEIVDAARKRIGKRFKDEKRKRLSIVVLAFDAITLAPGFFEANLCVLIRMREGVGQKSEQAGGAD